MFGGGDAAKSNFPSFFFQHKGTLRSQKWMNFKNGNYFGHELPKKIAIS